MTVEQLCPDCGAPFEPADNYCRSCGMYLAALRAIEPAAAQGQALERPRAQLPAPVAKAATAIAVGAALQIGVAVAGKYLARQAAASALSAVTPKPQKRAKVVKPGRDVAQRRPSHVMESGADEMGDSVAVAETFIFRRVWIRK